MTQAAIMKARAAWGDVLPDWVRVLAEECDKSSQRKVAAAINNSTTVVSRVLSNSYEGSLEKIAGKVRGVYLAEEVACPVLGDIPRQRCIAEQEKPLTFQNPLRRRVYNACRGGCPHSRIGASK